MGWVYAFWALGAIAVLGIVADVIALRRKIARKAARAALILKGLVLVAFAGWWAYFQLVAPQGWEDLASFAGILVVSVPVLVVAIGLDVAVLRGLARTEQG